MPKQDAKAFRLYVAAHDAMQEGDDTRAAELFERSVGSQPNNPVIRRHIHSLLDLDKPIGQLAINLIGDHPPQQEESHDPGPNT